MSSAPTVIVIQARMTSSRLPGKVLRPLAGVPIIEHVVRRALAIGAEAVCVAIPEGDAHDPIVEALAGGPAIIHRGSENDVLDRFAGAIRATGADTVMRITSDCPCLDPALARGLLQLHRAGGVPYTRNAFESGLPHGMDMEIVSARALLEAAAESDDPYEREHVTPFLWRRPERFRSLLIGHRPDLRELRLTVDTPEDYAFAAAIFDRLHARNPLFGLADVLELLEAEPGLRALNPQVQQKPYEGRPDSR